MLKIERLSKRHDRKEFDCGNEALTFFLRNMARQHAERDISRTFVLIDDETPHRMLGYFTLTVCEVIPTQIPDQRLRKYPNPLPATRMARLAIASDNQRTGLGKLLVVDAMRRTLAIREHAGIIGMFIDAKNAEGADYYTQNFGFVSLQEDPLNLFLPIHTISRAF